MFPFNESDNIKGASVAEITSSNVKAGFISLSKIPSDVTSITPISVTIKSTAFVAVSGRVQLFNILQNLLKYVPLLQ